MINITIDKQVRFDLPHGKYEAKITGVKLFKKQAAKSSQDWIRILFEVDVPGMKEFDCRAGRNFMLCFKPGSDLRNFLLPFLGPDFFLVNSSRTVDLESLLVDTKGAITLSHFCGEGYDKPLVIVEAIEPLDCGPFKERELID